MKVIENQFVLNYIGCGYVLPKHQYVIQNEEINFKPYSISIIYN